MEELEPSWYMLFVGHGYLQHAGAALKAGPALEYHTYLTGAHYAPVSAYFAPLSQESILLSYNNSDHMFEFGTDFSAELQCWLDDGGEL